MSRRYGNITLTKAQEQEFREIFALVDRDGGGSISKSELGELLSTLNLSLSAQELDLMVYEIDQNNDGEVSSSPIVSDDTLSCSLTNLDASLYRSNLKSL
jgi:calmodulin